MVPHLAVPLTYLLVPRHIDHNVNAHRALVAFTTDPPFQNYVGRVWTPGVGIGTSDSTPSVARPSSDGPNAPPDSAYTLPESSDPCHLQ
jgi:hypothetical protein